MQGQKIEFIQINRDFGHHNSWKTNLGQYIGSQITYTGIGRKNEMEIIFVDLLQIVWDISI